MGFLIPSKKGSTRDSIVSILKSEWPLSLKEIHNRIVKEAAAPVSYQAVHKAVSLLEADGTLEKTVGKYRISQRYVEGLEKTCRELKEAYSVKQSSDALEFKQMLFDNMIDLGRFIVFEFLNYPKSKELPNVCHWSLMYSLIGLSKQDIKELEKNAKEKQIFVLCRSNGLVDRLLAHAFKKLGVKVKLGIPVAFACDLFIVGDHVLEIYYNSEHKKIWKKIWAQPVKISDFDLNKTLTTMFSKNPTRAIIYKNPEIAKQIREKTLAEFKK